MKSTWLIAGTVVVALVVSVFVWWTVSAKSVELPTVGEVSELARDLFPTRRYRIPGSTMEPTISVNQRIWARSLKDREKATIRRGDIVVFVPPTNDDTVHLKRVVAIGGDRVELRDQQLWVNGEKVTEEYGRHPALRGHEFSRKLFELDPARHVFGPYEVPPGHLFLLGDNWEVSEDSRMFGPVGREALVAKLVDKWRLL